MAASIVEIADAITLGLNTATLSAPLVAVRAYRLEIELPEMEDLHVTVIPQAAEAIGGSRGQRQIDCRIDLAFQKRIAGDADIDGLLLLVQEAADWLYGRRLDDEGGAVCVQTVSEPLIESDHLRELNQFTSVLRATCRLGRDRS